MNAILQNCIRLLTGPEAIRPYRGGRPVAGPAPHRWRPVYRFQQAAQGNVVRCRGVSDERRRAMILETQRYLNNPRSQAWLRRDESPDAIVPQLCADASTSIAPSQWGQRSSRVLV